MAEKVFNLYLPSNEYIPDGEPRVLHDRLYILGTHAIEETRYIQTAIFL